MPQIYVFLIRSLSHTRTHTHTLSTSPRERIIHTYCNGHHVNIHLSLPVLQVRLEIWDHDTIANNTHIASRRFSLSSAVITERLGPKAPVPTWYKLHDTNGKPGSGEILTSIQVRQYHEGGNTIEFISPAFIRIQKYILTRSLWIYFVLS